MKRFIFQQTTIWALLVTTLLSACSFVPSLNGVADESLATSAESLIGKWQEPKGTKDPLKLQVLASKNSQSNLLIKLGTSKRTSASFHGSLLKMNGITYLDVSPNTDELFKLPKSWFNSMFEGQTPNSLNNLPLAMLLYPNHAFFRVDRQGDTLKLYIMGADFKTNRDALGASRNEGYLNLIKNELQIVESSQGTMPLIISPSDTLRMFLKKYGSDPMVMGSEPFITVIKRK